jgi:hypothetical protein
MELKLPCCCVKVRKCKTIIVDERLFGVKNNLNLVQEFGFC